MQLSYFDKDKGLRVNYTEQDAFLPLQEQLYADSLKAAQFEQEDLEEIRNLTKFSFDCKNHTILARKIYTVNNLQKDTIDLVRTKDKVIVRLPTLEESAEEQATEWHLYNESFDLLDYSCTVDQERNTVEFNLSDEEGARSFFHWLLDKPYAETEWFKELQHYRESQVTNLDFDEDDDLPF